MSRPSKLTDKQWGEIGRRVAGKESLAKIAKDFKVSKSTISGRFSNKIENLKKIANDIVTADMALAALPDSERCSVISMVDQLKAIGNNLATAANYGSATSAHLAKIAHARTVRLNENSPEILTSLKDIAGLTQVGNDAAAMGLSFQSASKPKEDPGAGQGSKDDLLREIASLLPN